MLLIMCNTLMFYGCVVFFQSGGFLGAYITRLCLMTCLDEDRFESSRSVDGCGGEALFEENTCAKWFDIVVLIRDLIQCGTLSLISVQ